MDKNKTMILQRGFCRAYNIMAVISMLAVIINFRYADSMDHVIYYELLVIIALAVVSMLIHKLIREDHGKILAARVFEFFVSSCFFMFLDPNYLSLVIFLIAIMKILEIAFEYDFYDLMGRNGVLTLIGVLLVIEFILAALYKNDFSETLWLRIAACVAIEMFAVSAFNSYYTLTENYESVVFAQARKIDNLDEESVKMEDTRKKYWQINEQLGVQKLKLTLAYDDIKKANLRLKLQNEIVKTAASANEMKELARKFSAAVVKNSSVGICAIMITKEINGGEEAVYDINSVFGRTFDNSFINFMKNGSFPERLEEMIKKIDNDVIVDDYKLLENTSLGSLCCIPFVVNGIIGGYLYAGSSKKDFFTDMEYLETIVTQLELAVSRISLFDTMSRMAKKDGLTGVYNRRYLNEQFAGFMNRTDLQEMKICVALFDIDHFKRFNDTYGHLFGDEVLKAVSRAANLVMKDIGGSVYRYGGEEFVCIKMGTDLKSFTSVIERLHEKIKSTELITDKGEKTGINVSIGISSYPETVKDLNLVLSKADKAMYYSKEHGRGRITIDREEL